MITPFHYLALSALVFGIGILGVLLRRNILLVLLSFEIILNAVNLAFLAFSRIHENLDGEVLVLFVIIIAACEAALGLAAAVLVFRLARSTNVDSLKLLKG